MAIPPVSRIPEGSGYAPQKTTDPSVLRLDGNEGAVPDAAILEDLAHAGTDVVRNYPDAAALEEALTADLGITREEILITAGADEALDRIARAFLEPGRRAVIPTPTFEMIERYVALTGAAVTTVPWPGHREKDGGDYPVDEVLRAIPQDEPTVVFVVSPNNPTGGIASREAVRRLTVGAPSALLVFDLAYAEFADDDLTSTLRDVPNALVVRTLSKAWGLAGLRIGWVTGPPELLRALRCAGGPYSVGGPSVWLAARWLKQGRGVMATFVARIRRERDALFEQLENLGCKPQRSQGNFVLARPTDPDGLVTGLLERGIRVRNLGSRPGVEGAVRITCPGDDNGFARLTSALADVLGNTQRPANRQEAP